MDYLRTGPFVETEWHVDRNTDLPRDVDLTS